MLPAGGPIPAGHLAAERLSARRRNTAPPEARILASAIGGGYPLAAARLGLQLGHLDAEGFLEPGGDEAPMAAIGRHHERRHLPAHQDGFMRRRQGVQLAEGLPRVERAAVDARPRTSGPEQYALSFRDAPSRFSIGAIGWSVPDAGAAKAIWS
jgi:hypothetical protein